jgi:hypothetical protein
LQIEKKDLGSIIIKKIHKNFHILRSGNYV